MNRCLGYQGLTRSGGRRHHHRIPSLHSLGSQYLEGVGCDGKGLEEPVDAHFLRVHRMIQIVAS